MNKPELPPCLLRLSLGVDADPRAIRRAYARELKLIDQEADPAGFQSLREQYEEALQWHAWQTWESEQQETEPSEIEQPAPPPVSLAKAEVAEFSVPADLDCAAGGSTQDLATAVFQRLADACERLTAEPDCSSVEAWEQAIRTQLTADELFNIDARTLFEQLIVDWLAAGWVPGKEKLFAAAADVFNWPQDRRRLQQFGYAGSRVGQALDERTIFLNLPEEELNGFRNTVAQLRARFEPDSDRLQYIMRSVEQLMARFPALMALSVSEQTVAHWREVFVRQGGNIEKEQQAAASEPRLEQSGGGFPWGIAVFALITVLRMCSSTFSSDHASPPPERGAQIYLPSSAPVTLDQNVVDAIGADLRYSFPADTPHGTYTVSFDLLVDLQGNVTFISEEKSPYPGFDEAVRQAILRAQPFPGQVGKLVKFSHNETVK